MNPAEKQPEMLDPIERIGRWAIEQGWPIVLLFAAAVWKS
jgi:hypothetical protein